MNNEPMRKLVDIKDDEIAYTDKEIEKNIVVITRKYVNVTTNDKTTLMSLDSVIKNNESYEYENKILTVAQETRNLIQNKIPDFKFTHDISNVRGYEKIEYSEKDIVEYIWLEDGVYNHRVFNLLTKITPESFTRIPIIPEDERVMIIISSPDDYKMLINDGYDIRMYKSVKQFKKDIALFSVRNKKFYGMSNLSDDEIYFNMMQDKPSEPLNNPHEEEVFKRFREILETTEENTQEKINN